jgi:hypothetical protein
MSDLNQEPIKDDSEANNVQQDVNNNANEQSGQLLDENQMIVDEAHPLPSNKLFEGFFIALSHGDIEMDTNTAVLLGELQRKITEHGGTFHREINERVSLFAQKMTNFSRLIFSSFPLVTLLIPLELHTQSSSKYQSSQSNTFTIRCPVLND